MSDRPRIYLDNAATSWPKPPAVYEAVEEYQRHNGAAVGRGGYAEAEDVGQAVDETRALAASLIGAESPKQIIFTFNGTDSLNLAIHGLLQPGDHVVTSVAEHNSVLRPLRRLEKRGRNKITRVGCDSSGLIDPDDIQAALRPETKLVILTHASNVTGAIQPVAEVGSIVREHSAQFLVDAAQTLGHIPVSVAELNADLLAAPGHKGLLGPLGTGILYIRPGVEDQLETIRQGGTGSTSSSEEQPGSLPEKYESGNHNAPGIVGLGAGLQYIAQRGIEDIRRHSVELTELLLHGLSDIPGVELFGPQNPEQQIGVVSFSLAGHDPPALAQTLASEYGIQCRAGFQCAALMHRSLGTLESNGTARFSIGPFNTTEDIDSAIQAVGEIARTEAKPESVASCPCVSAEDSAERESSLAALPSGPAASVPQMVTPAVAVADVAETKGTDITTIPGLKELWEETLGDPSVCIAVLDGPVDLSHPCFEGANISNLESMVPSDVDDGPASQHGTHVASVIFGQHQSEVKGIAPKCRGLSIPIFQDNNDKSSFAPCSQVDLARAISQAVEAGANIINISGGQFSPSGAAHPILSDVVRKCADRGVLLVAAAGNQGCECLHIPGAIPSVLAVGAMDGDGDPLQFSNWGYGAQGILALGEGIQGASPMGKVSIRSGTSFAAPIVSGLSGLLMSLHSKRGADVSATEVRSILLSTAIDCEHQTTDDCERLLAGRLNVSEVYRSFRKGKPHMTSTDQLQPSNEPHAAEKFESEACSNAGNPTQLTESGSLSSRSAIEPASRRQASTNAELDSPNPRLSHHRSETSIASSISEDTRTVEGKSSDLLLPSDCGCSGANTSQLVFALGTLGYDFGTEARFDSWRVEAGNDFSTNNVQKFLEFLAGTSDKAAHPEFAEAVIWTLNFDQTAIYAIRPKGGFQQETYQRLRQFLAEQQEPLQQFSSRKDGAGPKVVERVAIPGYIVGQVRLFSGQVVPVIQPELRGMSSWNTQDLANAVVGALKSQYEQVSKIQAQAAFPPTVPPDEETEIERFLDRIYYEFRNFGVSPQERAINFGATNALLAGAAITKEAKAGNFLQTVNVERSPICRPDSDCWDITLTFFNPMLPRERARVLHRFAVDVSDVIPVVVGEDRSWHAY